ncbi:MAG: kinase/pyrophosphorylase [Gammaproteobacteria bacterium]|nr:kinase/pyrophosphorylase [Gammaproteobacteria bacterium]
MGQQTGRTVFFVSDRTGISVETLGRGLLSQFEGMEFNQIALPFIDTEDKARAAVAQINAVAATGERPLVFSTQVRPELGAILKTCQGLYLDFFAAFMGALETELRQVSSHSIGLSHGLHDEQRYDTRIDAVNFALSCDDGIGIQSYAAADVIVVGVSRSGKTPTCLYLAMQYGVRAANYPLTEDDFEHQRLPAALSAHRARLVGLTITPERLQQIRQERRPNSPYAALAQCQYEARQLQTLLAREQIRSLDSTHMSIEEIAASIVHEMGLVRRR